MKKNNDVDIIFDNEENKIMYNKVEECIDKAYDMTNDQRSRLSYDTKDKYDNKILVNKIRNMVFYIMTDVNYKYSSIKDNIIDINSMKNIVVNMIMMEC